MKSNVGCMYVCGQHVCHLCVVLGACHVVLKPAKLAASRRGKKRKELDPQMVRQPYTHLLQLCSLLTCTGSAAVIHHDSLRIPLFTYVLTYFFIYLQTYLRISHSISRPAVIRVVQTWL